MLHTFTRGPCSLHYTYPLVALYVCASTVQFVGSLVHIVNYLIYFVVDIPLPHYFTHLQLGGCDPFIVVGSPPTPIAVGRLD